VKFWNKDISDDEEQGPAMAASLRDGANFVKKALSKRRGCCVVHCAAGISRSATLVLGYLVLHGNQSLRDAFALLYRCRPCIWPNEGFMAALIELEREARGETTMSVAEYERWGDYDGPMEAAASSPHMHALQKSQRQQAALQATDEVKQYHASSGAFQVRGGGGLISGMLRLFGIRVVAAHRLSAEPASRRGSDPAKVAPE